MKTIPPPQVRLARTRSYIAQCEAFLQSNAPETEKDGCALGLADWLLNEILLLEEIALLERERDAA